MAEQSFVRCADLDIKTRENEHENVLMVLTSHDRLGNTGRQDRLLTGGIRGPVLCLPTLASPKGGQPPIDPKSDVPENQTPAMTRFKRNSAALKDFRRQ
jgi:hypothetical protein